MKIEEIKEELKGKGFTDEQINIVAPILIKEKTDSFEAGVGNAYENVDKKVEELFGIQKQGKELSTVFLGKAFDMFKQGFEMDIKKNYSTIEEENKGLKEKLKSVPDAAKYEDLNKTYNEALKKHEEEINSLKMDFENKTKESKIDMYLNTLPFDASIDKGYLEYKKNSLKEDIKKRGFSIEEVGGKIVLKGGENEGHRNYNLEDFVKEPLKDVFKKETTTTPTPGAEGGGYSSKVAMAKTKDDFFVAIRENLEAKGMKVTDANWDSARAKEIEINKSILDSITTA